MSQPHKTLYLAYRPQNFDELEGQIHVKETLKNAARLEKFSHAYLFSGPRGTGKTSTARILAKAINCLNLKADGNPCGTCQICVDVENGFMVDVIEIDAASNRSIDDIRDLREKVRFAPTLAKRKVYIIDEVHMLTKDAFNALLKTLEEPPAHVYFILATTEFHKVLPTIISRCQLFQFYGLSEEDLLKRLEEVCKKEAFEYEKSALEMIAKEAAGGARDALSLLEKVAFQGAIITVEMVSSLLGRGTAKLYDDLFVILTEGTHEELFSLLQHLQRRGIAAENFMKGFIAFLRSRLLSIIFEKKNDPHALLFISTLIQELELCLQESKHSLLEYLPYELRLLQMQLKASGVSLDVPVVDKKINIEKALSTPAPQAVHTEKTLHTPVIEKPIQVEKIAPEKPPVEVPEPIITVSNISEKESAVGEMPPLSTLKRDWEKITAQLVKSITKLTFGKHSFPRKIEGNHLFLGVFGSVHMEKAESNKLEFEALLSKNFSCDIILELELEDAPAQKNPIKMTPTPMEPVKKEAAAAPVDLDDIAAFMGGTIL